MPTLPSVLSASKPPPAAAVRSASDATQQQEAVQGTSGDSNANATDIATAAQVEVLAAKNIAPAATAAAVAVDRVIPDQAADDAAAAAAAPALRPFQSVQGMGPAMLSSLLRFARRDNGNRPVVEALASEVRFTPQLQQRRRRSRAVVDGGGGAGGGDTASAWVEGKTVVFTGTLTRQADYFECRG